MTHERATESEEEDNASESVFIELLGVSPGDIPHGDEHDGKNVDASVTLANDIHQLTQEDYPFETDGVAAVVNTDMHERLNSVR